VFHLVVGVAQNKCRDAVDLNSSRVSLTSSTPWVGGENYNPVNLFYNTIF